MKKQIRILSAVLAAATLTSALALTACKKSSDNEGGTDMTDTRKETVNETQADTPVGMEAEVWSPVEIELQSTVAYENPYVETEIDATFTHTDGTVITLPGFWKKGKTWAVRFSPTKEGEWSYRVTCKDASNEGLFAEGALHATAATKDTALSEHGFVTIETGKRYYQHADGTPFFWLGDTNWQAFSAASTELCNYPGCDCGNQFKHIVDNRLEKGFTVYQTYFFQGTGSGERSLWREGDYSRPDTEVFNGKVDDMFAYLHDKGLVVALGLGCHTATTDNMKQEDLLRFTRYVVARYSCYSIVWISGQEINTDVEGGSITPGYSSLDCYMELSALIEELDGYNHPNSAHMYPMYAYDDRAKPIGEAEWHDFWTVQGGHSTVQPKAYYESYYNSGGSKGVKPFLESEANYEDINCGGFTGYNYTRMGAWKSILCGSAGFTYGTTGIWVSCFSNDTYTSLYGATNSYSYEPWYMGLDKPASFEMTYLKEFFTDIGPWYDLVPAFDDKKAANFCAFENYVMAATADGSLAVCYFYDEATTIRGTIRCLDSSKTYDAYWYNPRTGKYIPAEQGIVLADGKYKVPNKPDSADWVFLITSLGLGEHEEEALFTDLNSSYAQVAPTGNAVTPVSVKAVGGISYSGSPKDSQVMTDNTLWLCDGDPTTVWKPVVNRTTQTFLFDLGEEKELTHVTITPAEGTIIPTFRVEGSNDGKSWTIITDTSMRKTVNPGAGSEPLQGTYRYVKILLHNAESVNVGADQLDTLPYKAMFNPMTNNSYSVTEIADIVLYAK